VAIVPILVNLVRDRNDTGGHYLLPDCVHFPFAVNVSQQGSAYLDHGIGGCTASLGRFPEDITIKVGISRSLPYFLCIP